MLARLVISYYGAVVQMVPHEDDWTAALPITFINSNRLILRSSRSLPLAIKLVLEAGLRLILHEH